MLGRCTVSVREGSLESEGDGEGVVVSDFDEGGDTDFVNTTNSESVFDGVNDAEKLEVSSSVIDGVRRAVRLPLLSLDFVTDSESV